MEIDSSHELTLLRISINDMRVSNVYPSEVKYCMEKRLNIME